RLADHRRVAVIVGADDVEIVLPAIDGQILAPIILNPLERDAATRLEVGGAIRTAAERRLQRRPREVAALPVMLRQDGELACDQRQSPIVALGDGEPHLALAELLRLDDALIVEAVEGVPLR